MRYLLLIVCAAYLLSACRRTGPTGPDLMELPGQNGVLTVRQARYPDEPVAGATVMVVDGGTYVTDEQGQVALPTAFAGRVMAIIGHGYLQPRRIHYTPGMVDHLLPDDERMPGSWLHTAYYQTDESALHRPYAGHVGVCLSGILGVDAKFIVSARKAVEYINRAQSDVEFFISDAACAITMVLAPNDPIFSQEKYEDAWAVITGEFENGYTVSARVVWKFITRPEHHNLDTQALWQAIAHELGHYIGIWGHPPGGIMNEYTIPGVDDFNDREKAAMRYLFLRSVGTRKPDDSTYGVPGVRTLRTQQSGAPRTLTVMCGAAR